MNEYDILLRVQAFVDGELDDDGQAEIATLAARDPDVNALVKELKQTRQALTSHDTRIEVPESREFYWSQIERQITADQPPVVEKPRSGSLASILSRWLVPASCIAGIVALTVLLVGRSQPAEDVLRWRPVYDGVNAFTYRDYDEGVTVLWLTYSPDNTVANPEEAATIN